jgi:hypothetical protein
VAPVPARAVAALDESRPRDPFPVQGPQLARREGHPVRRIRAFQPGAARAWILPQPEA